MHREEEGNKELVIERSDWTHSKDILAFNTTPNPGQMALSWEQGRVSRM